ncbi:hypothetical protein BG004_004842 [Podila humilis]|nr:hypothetical protein BG004_004842 [Podila humilis]
MMSAAVIRRAHASSSPRAIPLASLHSSPIGQSRILVSNKRSTNRYFTLASKRNKDAISLTPKLKLRPECDQKTTKSQINPTANRYATTILRHGQRPLLATTGTRTTTTTVTKAISGSRLPYSPQQGRLGPVWQAAQQYGFHTSRPNHALPLIPAAIFTLKTPVTAVVLRMISRLSLTLLPLSAKQSPRVILTLVSIPPICFGLIIFAGLEAAPNTGRWRFLFTNEEEELSLLKDEIPSFMETIKVLEDENDPRVRLVQHILKNLLSTSIEQDGSTLRTGIVEKLEKRHEEAQQKLMAARQKVVDAATGASSSNSSTSEKEVSTGSNTNNSNNSTGVKKAIVSMKPTPTSSILDEYEDDEDEDDSEFKAMTFDERPFQIFVAEDDSINAFSLGPPRLIFINSGLMEWLENDEDLVAAVVAHELAHVIQRHTMETHGRETVMLFLADLFRSALWAVSIPLGPWFNSWVDKTTNDLLHFTASGPLHQAIEVEADTVSLTLLALAGYDPMHAVRLWEQWAEKDQKEIEEEDSAEVHKWTDWMYDHPPSAERARYLKDAVMPARDMWEKVLRRRKEPMRRFLSLDRRLKDHVDEDGDLVDCTVEDVMETMDELLKKQEEDEREQRRQGGIIGTIRRWSKWRPWSNTENVSLGAVESAQA